MGAVRCVLWWCVGAALRAVYGFCLVWVDRHSLHVPLSPCAPPSARMIRGDRQMKLCKHCEGRHETEAQYAACAVACCWCEEPGTAYVWAFGQKDLACAVHADEWGTALAGAVVTLVRGL